MMKQKTKLFTVFFVVLLLPTTAICRAQRNVKIVMLDEFNAHLASQTCKISLCDSVFVATTDAEGSFSFRTTGKSDCTTAHVVSKSMLYMNVDTVLNIGGVDTVFVIKMRPNLLGEVQVTGYRKVVKENSDKSIYRIDTAALLKNEKAEVAISMLPEIMNVNGAYKIAGKEGNAKIMINGLEASYMQLKTLDAKDIDRVEVRHIGINDDTTSGEINIITKKIREAKMKGEFTGSKCLNRESFYLFPNIAYQDKNIDINGFFSWNWSKQKNSTMLMRDGVENYYIHRKPTVNQLTGLLNSNFKLSKNADLSINYTYFGVSGKGDQEWRKMGETQPNQDQKEVFGTHYLKSMARFNVGKTSTIFVRGMFTRYNSTNRITVINSDYKSLMREYTGELQYQTKIMTGKLSHDFTTLFKSIYRDSRLSAATNKYESDVQQLVFKDYFRISKRLNLNVMARMEWDGYKMGETKVRDFNFLPTATLGYNSSIGRFYFSYQRKITRPNIDNLNPELNYKDEFSQQIGNPELDAQKSNIYSVRYTKQIKSVYLSLIFAHNDMRKMIEPVYLSDYNTLTYENAGKGTTDGLTASLTIPMLSRKLNVNMSVTAQHADYSLSPLFREGSLSLGNDGWSFTGNLSAFYLAPKDWFFSLSCRYVSRGITMNSTEIGKPLLQFSAKKSLLKGKLDISCYYIDMFNLSRRSTTYYHLRGIDQKLRNTYDSSSFGISATIRLGKTFNSRRSVDGIVNDDLNSR